MNQSRREISLGFTSEHHTEGQHICYIFNNENERRQTMAKYLQAGLDEQEKVLYLVDRITPDELVDELESLGVDIRSHKEDYVFNDATPTYCPTGHFSCQEMLDVVGDFYNAARDEGYIGARGTGEMTWALDEGRADMADLLEYEAKLTDILDEYPYTACCQYDASKFDGSMIMDVLSVHPVMIVQGQLVKNPYFLPPEEFMRSYRERQNGAQIT
jgi:MEDS: MEthanogen/methylotroph, DcmR Sensory domain